MYPVSDAYRNAITQNERNVRIVGTITLKDGTVINIDDEDILQGSLYLSEQCVSGEDIEVGNVYASELGFTLTAPPANPYILDGARVVINFGIETSEGVWEYVPLGYYYVTEIERKNTAVAIKALDGMILFDVDSSGILTVGSPYEMISACCNKVGIILANSPADFQSFANGNKVFTLPSDSKVQTCRDLIMWLCQLMGAFARMNRLGQLEIVPIKASTNVKVIDRQQRFSTDVSDFVVKVTKIAMKVGDTDYLQGTDGVTMTLEENPFLLTMNEAEINTVLTNILNQVGTVEYTPGNVNFIGDPALQAGDWIKLTGVGLVQTEKDTVFLTGDFPAETDVPVAMALVTHSTWRYRGPHNIKAVGKSALVRGVQAQQTKSVSAVKAVAETAREIARAANQSTQLIQDAITGYVLIRKNETTGSNEILIMDNPDPAQARKVWRWNMGGLGYSDNVVGVDNPDRVYNVAMTMDGAINADFIRTGKLASSVVTIGPETTYEVVEEYTLDRYAEMTLQEIIDTYGGD